MSNAKNLRTKLVPIDIGGKVRTIKFDLNAYSELELKYGSIEKAMNTLQEGSLTGLRNILWAGLIHEEAVFDEITGDVIKYNITPHTVGSWIEPQDLQMISTTLGEAIMETLPANQREDAKKEFEKLTETLVVEQQKIESEKTESEKN